MEIAPASLPKRIVRVIVRGCALLWIIVCCLAEYSLRGMGGRLQEQARIEVLHRWSLKGLRNSGIRVEVTGSPAAAGLIASNHLSYLDILVYSAIAPCAFVAKREVRAWPAVGWIATLAGTIYVDRSRRSETHTISRKYRRRLQPACACSCSLKAPVQMVPACCLFILHSSSLRLICRSPFPPLASNTPFLMVLPPLKRATLAT